MCFLSKLQSTSTFVPAKLTAVRMVMTIRFNQLILSGTLWTYLADLNEQAQARMETLIAQMKAAEGVTESLKATDPMAWVQRMNCIRARAEEIVREEIIYGEAAV